MLNDVLREGTDVLVDAATINTLCILQEGQRLLGSGKCEKPIDTMTSRLLGVCDQSVVADVVMRDLLQARDSMNMVSSLTITYDSDRQQPVVHEESAESLASIAARSKNAVALAQSLPSISAMYEPRTDREQIQDSAAWLGLIEFGAATARALWSDDLALRRLARSEGVRAFGTTTILVQFNGKRSGRFT